ncbi:hypothetical protein M514_06362 [Trichuris suis]|uniref:Uncharacterized protein n=1 Tax=Trichuris suis TaxID=68888 RepID=A0A085M660_9BILA|nr:hypothetical protein M513_06362 [Trichuris suis]KFD71492.1 hypothetical protein M514_06362 [Trichuris suis]KHJ42702.1 hypothetical protein D918_07200 [Trichuris suis]
MSAMRSRMLMYTVLVGSIAGSIYAWWNLQSNPVLVPPNERGDVKIKEGLQALKKKISGSADPETNAKKTE